MPQRKGKVTQRGKGYGCKDNGWWQDMSCLKQSDTFNMAVTTSVEMCEKTGGDSWAPHDNEHCVDSWAFCLNHRVVWKFIYTYAYFK